jgi:hypothetical protein
MDMKLAALYTSACTKKQFIMKSICPRCSNAFSLKVITGFQPIPSSTLNTEQSHYVSEHYTQPLCNQCVHEISSNFYNISINPKFNRPTS